MGLTDTIRQPIGPLPAWGWGVVVVGGFVAYKLIKGGGSSSGGGLFGSSGDNQIDGTAFGTGSPLPSGDGSTPSGNGDTTINNITITGWPKAIADRFKQLSMIVQQRKDRVNSLTAAIKRLRAIPLRRRTAAQKKALAADVKALAAAKAALAAAEGDLTKYENGVTVGNVVAPGSTLGTSSTSLPPSLAADVNSRIAVINGQTYVPAITQQSA